MWDEAHGGGDEARAVAAAVSDVGEVAEEQGGRSEDDATPLPAHRGATEEAHGVVRRQEDLLDELVHESLRHAGFGLGDWAGQRSEAKLRTNCDSDGWISVGRRCRQGQPNL